MNLYEYLVEKYGYNEPIISNRITFGSYSRPWILKELNKLCDEQKIIRYEKGIYYIPTETVFGKSVLNPRKAIEKKYIVDDNKQMGYYSGLTLLNQLGISTQMPNVIEIFTNNEASNARTVTTGNQKIILRKARTVIDNTNVFVLSFLELMNSVTPAFFDEEKVEIIKNFIKDKKITQNDISKYAKFFPEKVFKNLVESGVIYSVTQWQRTIWAISF